MSSFTFGANRNINDIELTPKQGADTYACGNFSLTIDCDTRYGLNQNPNAALGNISCYSIPTGNVIIDGTKVRLIPFSASNGATLPTLGQTVTQGGASGVLIGVWTSMTTAPTLSGVVPASGFIKIKGWNNVPFTAGEVTFTGSTATVIASGSDVAGWIEVVFREGSSITIGRLGSFDVKGEWFELGLTTANDNTVQWQIPTSGVTQYIPGVYVEKSVGANDFTFYPNIYPSTGAGAEKFRGQVCWINPTTGVVRIGHNGTATDGWTIGTTGLRVVMPNVNIQGCLQAGLDNLNNCIPNITATARWSQVLCVGTVRLDKCIFTGTASFAGVPEFSSTFSCFHDQVSINRVANNLTVEKCGIGITTKTPSSYTSAMVLQYVGNTSIVRENIVVRAMQSSGPTCYTIRGLVGVMEDCKGSLLGARTAGVSSPNNFYIADTKGLVVSRQSIICGALYIETSSVRCEFNDTAYCDIMLGTTGATYALTAVYNCGDGCVINGFNIPIHNTHPYANLVNLSNTTNSSTFNMGTKISPVNLGTVNKCGTMVYGAAGHNNKIKRCWASSVRISVTNPGNGIADTWIVENCGSVDFSGTIVLNATNSSLKGIQSASTSLLSVLGTHFVDKFLSTTTGELIFNTSEKVVTPPSVSAYTMLGGAVAPSILNNVGHGFEFEWSYYAIGHTGFRNIPIVIYGGQNIANVLFNYQIDKNDGNGFSAWQTINQNEAFIRALLVSENIPDSSKGFKLRLRVVCSVANNAIINTITIATNSSPLAQTYNYPLSVATVKVESLVTGSMVKATMVAEPKTVLSYGQETDGVYQFDTEYIGEIEIEARQGTNEPYYKPWITRGTTVADATITATALQQPDQ